MESHERGEKGEHWERETYRKGGRLLEGRLVSEERKRDYTKRAKE